MTEQKIKISWYGKHFGEEPPLVGSLSNSGRAGAGTIFFSGCNLHCIFCQNYQISQKNIGKEYSISELAQMMLDLQAQGAANIDLVTPTPWQWRIKEAIKIAKKKGLVIPIVWNSNAYESVAAIKNLKGIVDIFLPDFKYGDDKLAVKYSRAPKYCQVADKAIREMYHQVGLLRIDKNGLAKKGLIIRHLVLPNHLNNTFLVLKKIAAINPQIHLSLMSQYYPVPNVKNMLELNRVVSAEEIKAVEDKKKELNLENGWTQELNSGEVFLPDFNSDNPFKQ
jgi:putative pyruvate formate lyase activating enzyme